MKFLQRIIEQIVLLCTIQVLAFSQIDTALIKNENTTLYQRALNFYNENNYTESNLVVDEIVKKSKLIGDINARFTALTLKASSLLHDHKYKELDNHYEEMETILQNVKPHLQCFYWFNKAQYLKETNRYVEANICLNKGKPILNYDLKDFPILFYGYHNLQASIEKQNKNYKSSRELLNLIEDSLKSETFQIKNKNKRFYDLYNSLGNLSKDIQDYPSSETYFSKAIEYATKISEKNMINYNIANAMANQKKYNQALNILNTLNDNELELSTKIKKYFLYSLIYEGNGDKENYLNSFEKFKKEVTKENYSPLLIHIPLLKGIYHYFKGDYKKSISLCQSAIEQYDRELESFEKSKLLAEKYIGYSNLALENKFEEIENLQNVFSKKDSLDDLIMADNINKLHIEYQTVQQKRENELLKENNLLQLDIIGRQKILNLLTLLVALGFIIFSLIIYLQYRKSKILNLTLQHQKDQIQLLNRELNHRVKNNLTFMTSLLEMQGRRSDSIETKSALKESESRLKALALVHSQLFKSDSDTDVNLSQYLKDVTSHLHDIFSTNEKPIAFETQYIDFQINAEDAMRLGLIVNELVTNSVKHAFINVNVPQISIITTLEDGKLALKYEDNGPGISHHLVTDEHQTPLGIKLIDLLRKQLGDRYVVMV